MPAPPPVEDGPWAKGCDSWSEPTQVQKGFYRWAVNVTNRGGIVRTKPGYSVVPVATTPGTPLIGKPRGITIFTDYLGKTNLVVAIGTQILYTQAPFTAPFVPISTLSFQGSGPVCFTRCIVSVIENPDGSIQDINPVPILVIQDGASRAGFWVAGPTGARHLDPTKASAGGPSETPTGLWCAWSGNRLWVSNGSRVRASNLLNPIKFTEENLLEEGGFLQFPGDITAMTNTFDFTSLLVYTNLTTSTLLSSLIDRTQWATTTGFQKVIFDGIGCVGGNAVATQWGMKWWYSHDGLMGLDEGLRAYQSSKVTYRDREMAWSKIAIAPYFAGNIAMGSFDNLLFVSVPSGDIYNAQTWVMDEAPLDTLTYWGYFGLPAWSGIWEGIRPVAWVTAPIDGCNRIFCLSQDYPSPADPNPNNPRLTNNVWEMVAKERLDNTVNMTSTPVIQRIGCSLETKLLGYDGQYKFFRFAEIYLDNIEGEVDLTVSYAPRRGGYKLVLQKHIVSSDWIIQNPTTSIPVDGTLIFDPMRPESRVVRTISEAKTYTGPNSGDDLFQGVQTSANVPFPRQKDYAFSVLLQWTGRMSISSVRAYFDPEEQETEGIVEQDETTDRSVNAAGVNVIGPTLTPYILDPLSLNFHSNVMNGNAPIWKDPLFNSMA